MLCCVLATLGGSLLPPVPITAADASTAAADCNRLTSVINPGFVVEPTSSSDLWTCRSCASLVEQPEGCDDDAGADEQRTRVPDGQVATRVYDDGVDPSRRDYCTNTVPGGWECLVCTTGQTRGALRPPPTAVVHVSSNCSHLVAHTDENPAVGLVELGSPLLTVHGHGGYVMVPAMPAPIGRSFAMDDATVCPVNTSLVACAAGEQEVAPTALLLTADGNLSLTNVSSPMTHALVTARPVHARQPDLRLSTVAVVGSAQAFVAAFSHVRVAKAFELECTGRRNRVLFQTRRGATDSAYNVTGCASPINVADLLSAYGEHYEIAFNHDGVVKREASQFVKVTTRLLVYVNIALGVALVFGHEGDVRRLIARRK